MARPGANAVQRIYRARRIGTTFGRIYLGIRAHRFIANRLAPRDMDERWRRFHRESAQSIYDAAVELQGMILKGCQFLGTRADVLPSAYVEILSQLHDRVPARAFPVVRETVETELGAPLADVFSKFSVEPIASASLAQVHEAKLRTGERVAVKVQYPEIEDIMRGDLRNLRALFRAVEFLERDFELMPLIDELRTHVPRELDFVNEARNAERVSGFFAHRDDMSVPRVHWEHTTRRVLVMDFVDGVKITDLEGLERAGLEARAVAHLLVEAYCEQVMVHGFFHADPHPGNLMVQALPDGRPKLVFVDFGLAKELPPHFRETAVRFAAAMIQGQADEMANALLELGFETRDGRPESLDDIADFILDLAKEFRHGVKIDKEFTERFGREVPKRIRQNPIVRIPSHLVLLGRVVGLLAGVNKLLGSRLDLAKTVFPYAMGVSPRQPTPNPTQRASSSE
jgi:predicted unusual protein kinase regulating ubiquinone biosynthesis (AarF/ABC1/UbiB family)